MKQVKRAASSLGSRWPRMRCRASLRHTQGPLDRFKIHLANIRILPRFSRMSKRGVENPALAIHFAPCHWKVVVGAVDTRVVRVVQLGWIKAQQDIHLVPRPRFRLV